jgi:6-phosphogluconolactonase
MGVIPDQCVIHRIIGEAENIKEEAKRFESILPDSIDILLLSVGPDGHIASLFPKSEFLTETEKSIIAIKNSPKPPSKKITITPKVIKSAKNIIVMATGEEKGKVLAEALKIPRNIDEMPVRITNGENTTWILDKNAISAFEKIY